MDKKFLGALVAIGLLIGIIAGLFFGKGPIIIKETDLNKFIGDLNSSESVSKFVDADTINIILAVEVTKPTAAEASVENKKIAEKIVNETKKILNQKSDSIKTSAYRVQPVYEYNRDLRKNELIGYKATNEVTIKTKQLDKAPKILDNALEMGANNVRGVNFTLEDDEEHCRESISEATQKAKNNADKIAKKLGVKIRGVKQVSFSCGSQKRFPEISFQRSMMDSVAEASTPSTPLEPGEINLNANVNIVFFVE